MPGREETVRRNGLAWARSLYLGVLGVVLGVALVVALTDDLGRRVCGLPDTAVLVGCDR